ncbi:hypothetical protein NHX12_013992 [Muraenolepis orangiensis]|uniref:Sphingomyelin synthase-like domain-containing protein n=1 Tax=Muraenolepis orangiensis TaxID=630683 RepID=A0A9Q0DCQ8_9TELE|nr:hypothetical protein NHX12_013992 [Muraenolepis orangiensis]
MYRCVTMYITTLPVPGKHMVCAPKLYNDSTGKIWRVLRLISGGGLSLTGSHLMCGDFLYNSPRKWWWYRWLCWFLCATGVVCILVGHEHYSVDVVALRQAPSNLLARVWWNRVFNFLERNVQEPVPVVFSWPVALPSSCTQRYRIVDTAARDE